MRDGRYTWQVNHEKYADDYREFVCLAGRIAHDDPESEGVISIKHLLMAIGVKARKWLPRALFGRPLVFPHPLCALAKPDDCALENELSFSSDVHRILSMFGGELGNLMNELSDYECRVDFYLAAIALFRHPVGEAAELLALNAIDYSLQGYEDRLLKAAVDHCQAIQRLALKNHHGLTADTIRTISKELCGKLIGRGKQIHETMMAVAGHWNSTLEDRKHRPLSIVYIGVPGTGKTMLADEARKCVSEVTRQPAAPMVEMSYYASQQVAADGCGGRDHAWKDDGRSGEICTAASMAPTSVIALNDIEKAHSEALCYIDRMLATGIMHDAYKDEDVSFARNVVIMTLTAGAEWIETERFAELVQDYNGNIPKDRIIECVAESMKEKGVDDKRSALLSILSKVDKIICFPKFTADDTLKILKRNIGKSKEQLLHSFAKSVELDDDNLANVILDSLPEIGSAHGLSSMAKDWVYNLANDAYVNSVARLDSRMPVRFMIDPLPRLEDEEDSTVTCATACRTQKRLALAKRLVFEPKVKTNRREVCIHLTDMKYRVAPTIQDGKYFVVTPPTTGWADLVGVEVPCKLIRRELNRVKSGRVMSNSILLYGPPGCGKTSIAKATAKDLGVPFLSTVASDLIGSTPSEGIKMVKNLFRAARKLNALVFIDEVDALGSRDSGNAWSVQVLNAFLQEMDGFKQKKVLLMAATNRKEALDSALLRSGRFGLQIKVEKLVCAADRKMLIEGLVAKHDKDLPNDLMKFAVAATQDWSPADITRVMTDVLDLGREGAPTKADFIAARNSVVFGEETQRRILCGSERGITAIHEAGHALIATLRNRPFAQVSIVGKQDLLGFVELIPERRTCLTATDLRQKIDISLGGLVAEELMFSESSAGSTSDLQSATKLAMLILHSGLDESYGLAVPPDEDPQAEFLRLRPRLNKILQDRRAVVRKELARRRTTLRRIAQRLETDGVLFEDDVRSMMASRGAAIAKSERSRRHV